jgi:ADP-ribose pyrophosphatase YjhB (NUDIX family)
LPGGHVESSDRSLPEAAHRELAEETGDMGRRAIARARLPQKVAVHQQVAQRLGSIRRRRRNMPVEGALRRRGEGDAQDVGKMCGTPEVDGALEPVA